MTDSLNNGVTNGLTNARWQDEARRQLQAAGLANDEAHSAARLLLDAVVGTRYAALLHPEEPLDDVQIAKLRAGLNHSLARRPLAHFLGEAPFWSRSWCVSSATLVPRPETEVLVETALERLRSFSRQSSTCHAPRVADLGTGTGVVALSLALELRLSRVWATEISPAAREIARQNARRCEINLELLEGTADWLAPLQQLEPFDAIVSNPPYIPAHEIAELQIEVQNEPHLALDGGADGLNPYRQFAARGRAFLKSDGFLAVELGMGQFDAVREECEANGWRVEPPIFDFAGIARVLVAWPLATP